MGNGLCTAVVTDISTMAVNASQRQTALEYIASNE